MNFKILNSKVRTLKQSFKKKNRFFSFPLALSSVLYDLNGSTLKSYKLQIYLLNKKSKIIFDYLKSYEENVLSLLDGRKTKKITGKYPIWTFWYQGFESAPDIVRKCRSRMLEVFDEEKYIIHMLDMNNVEEYIEIPSYIKEKVKSGNIGLALFSDFIRISLIEKYGGLWLDSTCYCFNPLQDLTKYPFYSCKTDNMNPLLISREQWANYCLGSSQQHSILFQYLHFFLLDYWKFEDADIDYLLTDYLIRMAYKSIPSVKDEIKSLKDINPERGMLLSVLNKKYSDDYYNQLTKKTWIFKLTYKQSFLETDDCGNATFYKVLFDNRY